MNKGFTLIELMIVVAIMGLLGTISIGGYRAMRRGMEERGVMQNASQFIRNAYQRATIDRQPTAVYFWNETLQEESEDSEKSLIVVGHAVAVRQAGRVSRIDGNVLVDEFGDLYYNRGTDEDGEDDDDQESNSKGSKAYLYRIRGNQVERFTMSPAAVGVNIGQNLRPMLSNPDWDSDVEFKAYGYRLESASGWQVGDAYCVEFADITLPNNYIFGSSFQQKTSNPIQAAGTISFKPDGSGGSQTMQICNIRPGDSGAPTAKSIGSTDAATKSK